MFTKKATKVCWQVDEAGDPNCRLVIRTGRERVARVLTAVTILGQDDDEQTSIEVIRYTNDDRLVLKDGYYRSSAMHQATFDSFVYNSAENLVTAIQITVSASHSVSIKGLEWLRTLRGDGKQEPPRIDYVVITPGGTISLSLVPAAEKLVRAKYHLRLNTNASPGHQPGQPHLLIVCRSCVTDTAVQTQCGQLELKAPKKICTLTIPLSRSHLFGGYRR